MVQTCVCNLFAILQRWYCDDSCIMEGQRRRCWCRSFNQTDQHLRSALHKWTPTPCPFIAAGGSESINQLVKRSPGDGTRRKKLTFLQQCKCIIELAYRSYRLLKHGPLLDSLKTKKRIERHLQRQGNMCEGKYAVLLAGMQQLSFRAVSTQHTPTFLFLPHHHAP